MEKINKNKTHIAKLITVVWIECLYAIWIQGNNNVFAKSVQNVVCLYRKIVCNVASKVLDSWKCLLFVD